MKPLQKKSYCVFFFALGILLSCKQKNNQPLAEDINAINLKKGPVILCGPADKEVGNVEFAISNGEKLQKEFNFGAALLHSFEYDDAEKVFAGIIEKEPGCAMAYWGVAMSNYHPLWTPPEEPELKKGLKALEIARSINQKTERESAYIDALTIFYKDWDKVDYRTRCTRYEKAMEAVYQKYPDDKEAAIFYSLSLVASADPADQSFTHQKKAGEILNGIYQKDPDHPGIIHYIIHTYDSPALAHLALPAARKYASVAPSSAHAQHMPSHIFIRLGLWNESIQSDIASTESAKCYAESSGIKGHWDEELHGLDYLVYSYLQKGETKLAKEQLDYLKMIKEVHPANFKVAYSFASIPARYVLENKMWKDAASLETITANFSWKKFPWQKAITHFARCLGAANSDQLDLAKAEWNELNKLHDELVKQKETYKANQVDIQLKASEAWILWTEGKSKEALDKMNLAAYMEDKTEKHPVTPGEVLPARELLADMLLQMNKPGEALDMYEVNLKKHPNRRNSLYGAWAAAEASGKKELAKIYSKQFQDLTGKDISAGPKLISAIIVPTIN
jgi:tetratricopeptide (TPR) repeat protein